MSYIHSYIYFITAIKFVFFILAIIHLYLRSKGQADSDLGKNIEYWKERIEFIFVILMSFLLIYLFNPRYNNKVLLNFETNLLLYLFGFILIITAKWSLFFKEAKWFNQLQEVIGKFN